MGKIMDNYSFHKEDIHQIVIKERSTNMWQPGWGAVWGRMATCICMAELFCCASETITTLLIGYAPI